ncbi:UDP-N-acetylmuramate--L-alanine ligase [Temperatibacter marinus]|uniref:UDP-N-acetylmuramate--L-alanine ligase n=1 Tax=Temperatibacter marinus TaxID=1456591 RepID=A0AA52H9E3_9PROT|nr:UDP-N-acetylmuramate--L-alanine ligase [Temperatibacter marinus]WND01595.1 UDP-N-acetylmuramate--L-alanine ligase [Temperatibacter marinus]
MKEVPFKIGVVHFIGIGGIGMSGIAEVMFNLGYTIQGSDVAAGPNVVRLQELGIKVFVGQTPANIEMADVVVVSTAIKDNNPELKAARERGLPVVRRAEMLAELMRLKWTVSVAGTHGKTTTTSMVATVLEAAGVDPTVINGGIINAYGTNARMGEGDWMVVEADESDGTFVKLPATVAVVTNMDPEHLDFYGTFEAEKEAFKAFLDRVPFYGAAVLCIDHPEVQRLMPEIQNRRVISYGTSPQAAVRAINITPERGGVTFDVALEETKDRRSREISRIHLPMPGLHNVQNALAAIAVGLEMDSDDETLREAFANFAGVKRRFTHAGIGGGITVIDDYGHHPVEIAAVLNAARESFDHKVIAVMQPHRYSRLSSLFEEFCTCFNDADTVIVSPVFEAGESPIEGFSRDDLAAGLKLRGHKSVDVTEGDEDLADVVSRYATEGDAVICLGAGTITKWAHNLPDKLESMKSS